MPLSRFSLTWLLALGLAFGLGLLATGCRAIAAPAGLAGQAAPAGAVQVVTSITVLGDLIAQVGGSRVVVTSLVPVGADPNTFQPAPRHVVSVSRADLVFLNGLGLDRTVRTVVENANRPALPTVVLSDGLPTLEGLPLRQDAAGSGTAARANPYLWLDPRLAAAYLERIASALARVDPEGAADYEGNAREVMERVLRLDREVEAQLDQIPPDRRKLVTLHDGFPYFANRYGFQIVGVVIRTPGREPSAQEIASVATTLREHNVPTVFIEPQLDARLLKLAARDAGLQISTLYSDTLDRTVPSYEALLRYNARHLVDGLK